MSFTSKELQPLIAFTDKDDYSPPDITESSSTGGSGPDPPKVPINSAPSIFRSVSKGKEKDEEDEETIIVNHLDPDTERTWESLVFKSTINENNLIPELIRAVNGNRGTSASESSFGSKVVDTGKIGIINHNGSIQVVGPGRYMIPNPRAKWVTVVPITQNPIQQETLTIVRVSKGQIGLATFNGSPILLDEGVHVYNNRLFLHNGFQDLNQRHINHGTNHILLVPKGEYALVTDNNQPKILRQGRYVLNSNLFTFNGFVNANQEHVQHNTIHVVRVAKGSVGLITNNNLPRLIYEGTHCFNSFAFIYHGSELLNQESIVHGTITRFRVRNGEIALIWDNNRPVFVDKPDFYEVDSPSFTFVKCVTASTKQIVLGSLKRIMVYDGEVGISYTNGKLEILEPKTHIFDSSERIFSEFLSTQQQCLRLHESHTKDHFLRCDTKDFVEIGIKADVFYKIGKPQTAILEVGNQDRITKLIAETGIATLQSIIRSSSLNEVAQSKEPMAISEQKHLDSLGSAPSAPLFFDKVHDDFISRLHDGFLKHYGIDIGNIRIESFKIMDKELADNISKQAMITATVETKLANLTGQKEIATAEMERDAEVSIIKVNSQARQLATDTNAMIKAKLDQAKAKADSTMILAKGEAQALLIKAEAEALAIERRAEAEGKRAELLSKTPLGGQLALFELQTEMVKKAMQGVEKIVYIPSSTTGNGMSMPFLPGMFWPSGQSSSYENSGHNQRQ